MSIILDAFLQHKRRMKIFKIKCSISRHPGVALKDLFLLDSDSTDTYFATQNMSSQIDIGVGDESGLLVSNQVCDIPDLGKASFKKD